MNPGQPDYEARLAADIARLQGAKGVQLGAWFRQNKALVAIFAVYFGLIGAFAAYAVSRGDSPMGGVLVGVIAGPLVMLRTYLRWKRRSR